MKKIFLICVLASFVSFGISAEDESPVKFKLEKSFGNSYLLKIVHPANYGIQKDAPHKILLNAGNGLKIEKADLKVKGKTSEKKKEYLASVDPIPLVVTGKGELEIHGKIYYCNFDKNICIPGKIQQIEIIQ
ncbi:cell surface protein MPL17 [Leptospira kmetyi]|uniref:Thiol:disulfide interchange protein DsbD N-terminal domain-containing protein n=1 Tax=Leptospira kmetyi TaxID=408139 RepID=A0A2M9XLK0_9LEPT|nr:hypothetical protein [Leptospira kmetyi]AYV55070.1 hypothetical protein EFP84_05810 [Leptospira kmetyi]EQA53380.1 hypothetical protein LEP1GSC052_2499 [Leptospira kmetyi serovar Malaysia str. Bejo-Iso9]PJZ28205.1 hypothetical protein CH378_19065 [Leptospira kmetyi]PJZ40104.1 hypothetical protein CH370_18265 [Leptospira kmetyi]TGK19518.1 hypothetical protein EHO62_05910 [Leptospira kmetyi]